MKRFLAVLLALVALLGIAPQFAGAADLQDPAFAGQVIDLSGQWHFKVYRKYENMYQYFAYGGNKVTWENPQDAALPDRAAFSAWETVQVPASDYSTGGLLQMYRAGTQDDARDRLEENELFPKWSEAWFCRVFRVPEGFAKEPTVTLLLGVIDDLDVVYLNGRPVAASGFKKADGSPADPAAIPALGGFVADGDFQFEKSYWEVSRVYEIPADYLREGENELSIRLYNNNSFGGFYDRTIALAATKASVQFLKGLPYQPLEDSADYEALVKAQAAALESEDLDAYAATLSESYNHNELDKAGQLAVIKQIFDTYENLRVVDEGGAFYSYGGEPVYLSDRVLRGVKEGEETLVLQAKEQILYFGREDGKALETGNHSRCYNVRYTSTLEAMNGKQLQYSIYLPPSYYGDAERSYPVVYLLHGINSTGDSFVNVDRIADRMDEWIAEGLIREMIVVMPNSGKSSGYRDTVPEKDVSDSQGPWASHIYVDILGQIEGNYRVLKEKEFRGMTGISMGGGGVFRVGLAHPEIYTSFASHMGAVSDYREYIDAIPAEVLPTLDFYLDCGISDQMVDPEITKAAGEYLESRNANVIWELRDGAHNSAFYMEGMPRSMKMHSDHFIKNGLPE